jgi:hypothetical protein
MSASGAFALASIIADPHIRVSFTNRNNPQQIDR